MSAVAPEPGELLRVEDLVVHFPTTDRRSSTRATLRAVDGVSLVVKRGETASLVGESGCGKTTLARSILRLQKITEGRIVLDGEDITTMGSRQLRTRRPKMQVVFQDPYSSLNADMTVEQILGEPLRIAGRYATERVDELLALVGMSPAVRSRKPAQFSGGQRQRIAIARALALEPQLLILDEPVSSLDMSIQAQILNLLRRLRSQLGLTCLFIAHDLAAVRYVADSVAVMYLGRIVETGPCRDVFDHPQHPYTQSLLGAVPVATPLERDRDRALPPAGEPPDPSNPPSGCRFRTRCPRATTRCEVEDPSLRHCGSPDQQAACLFPGPPHR